MKINRLHEKYYYAFVMLFGSALTLFISVKAFNQTDLVKRAWFLVFQVFIGMLLCLFPFLIEPLFKIQTSSLFKKMYWLFIFLSIFLGTGLSFYTKVSFWDKGLHAFSGMLLVVLGLGFLSRLMPRFQHLSRPTLLLFAFFFAMTLGVYWEFYEFTFDGLLGLNMQQFATITGRNLVGRHSLMDTMGDLFANAAGASIFVLYSYFKLKKTPDWIQLFYFTSIK